MNTLLKGVKVLDLTSFVAGPTSTQLMAYMGANVVKVEMPVCGDSGRGMMNMKIGHHSGNILQTNHGRKSIELDIQDSEGREVFKRLVKDYDIVLEGFRPGLMAKYGLDYENLKAVNPKLIYCSISTYGQTGPYSKRPGFDLIAQAGHHQFYRRPRRRSAEDRHLPWRLCRRTVRPVGDLCGAVSPRSHRRGTVSRCKPL